MSEIPPLFIDIKASKLKLAFLVMMHVLTIASILLLDNSVFSDASLKVLFVLAVIASFRFYWHHQKDLVHIHFKSDNQVDLIIADQEHCDLNLSCESYISAILMLLVLKDGQTGLSHHVMVLPDSMDAAMHSQLRARLKLASNRTNTVLT